MNYLLINNSESETHEDLYHTTESRNKISHMKNFRLRILANRPSKIPLVGKPVRERILFLLQIEQQQ